MRRTERQRIRSATKFVGRSAGHSERTFRSSVTKVSEFIFIAVETSEPYGVACYALDEEVVALFDPDVDRAIGLWAEAVRSRVFRSYPDEVQKLGAPKWLRRQLEEGVAA